MNTSHVEQVLSLATNAAIKSSVERMLKDEDEARKKELEELEANRKQEFRKIVLDMVKTAQTVNSEVKLLEDRKAECTRSLALLKAELFNEDYTEIAELHKEFQRCATVDAEYAEKLRAMRAEWDELQLDQLPPSIIEDQKLLRGMQTEIEACYRIATGKEDEIKIAENQIKQLDDQICDADTALNLTLEASDLYNQKLKQIDELQTLLAVTENEVAETRRMLVKEGYVNGVDDYTVMSVDTPQLSMDASQDGVNITMAPLTSEITTGDPLNCRVDATLTDHVDVSKRTDGAGDASVNM